MIKHITAPNPLPDAPKLSEHAVPTDKQVNFSELLAQAIDAVNTEQLKAEAVTRGYLTGEIQDLHQVMIAVKQAELTMQLALEVRNKVVEAYQEISRIPV